MTSGTQPPLPGRPGPFSRGQPEVLKRALADSGFTDIRIEKVEAPVRLSSAADFQFEDGQQFVGHCEMLIAVGTR